MRFHLSTVDLLKSEAKLKIIKFLLTHEALMSEREIASILKVSHMSVNRAMRELAETNLVHYVMTGRAHLWKVNRKSYIYKILEKMVGNMAVLPDPLVELKQTILKHLSKSLAERIVLFGSIVKSSEKPNSDIDLFILVQNAESQKKIEGAVSKLSNECLEIFGNGLSPYILTRQQYKQKRGSSLITQINQGIPIYPDGNV